MQNKDEENFDFIKDYFKHDPFWRWKKKKITKNLIQVEYPGISGWNWLCRAECCENQFFFNSIIDFSVPVKKRVMVQELFNMLNSFFVGQFKMNGDSSEMRCETKSEKGIQLTYKAIEWAVFYNVAAVDHSYRMLLEICFNNDNSAQSCYEYIVNNVGKGNAYS